MIKISIIVPVYNVEPFIRKALDSILCQTLKELEIILIDDGSTDKSGVICDEYATKDKRIKVIHQSNSGLGKAYNVGMDASTGKYIGFIEPDDWIEPDMFEILYQLAEKNDVEFVKSDFWIFDQNTGKEKLKKVFLADEVNKVTSALQKERLFFAQASIWSAIYKRDFLYNNDIRFLETPGASFQDISFTFKVFVAAKHIFLTDKPLVHYRVGHLSQSVKSTGKVFCVCDEFAEIERYMNEYFPELIEPLDYIYKKRMYNIYTWNMSRLTSENKKLFLDRVGKEFDNISKYNELSKSDFEIIKKYAYRKNIYNYITYIRIRLNYYRCKILSILTFGKKKQHYKQKKKALKARIRLVRCFLKGDN